MKGRWLTYIGVLICGAWLVITLILRFEPAGVTFEKAQVLDNNVLSETTDTGPRFIYQTVFQLQDGVRFNLESPLAPPALDGQVCAQINSGRISGMIRYSLSDASNCL